MESYLYRLLLDDNLKYNAKNKFNTSGGLFYLEISKLSSDKILQRYLLSFVKRLESIVDIDVLPFFNGDILVYLFDSTKLVVFHKELRIIEKHFSKANLFLKPVVFYHNIPNFDSLKETVTRLMAKKKLSESMSLIGINRRQVEHNKLYSKLVDIHNLLTGLNLSGIAKLVYSEKIALVDKNSTKMFAREYRSDIRQIKNILNKEKLFYKDSDVLAGLLPILDRNLLAYVQYSKEVDKSCYRAINIALDTLREKHFLKFLNNTKHDASKYIIEFSCKDIISDLVLYANQYNHLSDIGYKVAIDHLTYSDFFMFNFKSIPFDYIKVSLSKDESDTILEHMEVLCEIVPSEKIILTDLKQDLGIMYAFDLGINKFQR